MGGGGDAPSQVLSALRALQLSTGPRELERGSLRAAAKCTWRCGAFAAACAGAGRRWTPCAPTPAIGDAENAAALRTDVVLYSMFRPFYVSACPCLCLCA
jgi:hypothetical protein